jgi:hypothetical protein
VDAATEHTPRRPGFTPAPSTWPLRIHAPISAFVRAKISAVRPDVPSTKSWRLFGRNPVQEFGPGAPAWPRQHGSAAAQALGAALAWRSGPAGYPAAVPAPVLALPPRGQSAVVLSVAGWRGHAETEDPREKADSPAAHPGRQGHCRTPVHRSATRQSQPGPARSGPLLRAPGRHALSLAARCPRRKVSAGGDGQACVSYCGVGERSACRRRGQGPGGLTGQAAPCCRARRTGFQAGGGVDFL